MTMPWFALRQDFPGFDIQRGEQRRGAVSLVVVGHALDVSQAERQHRLGPFQRLDLALLVDAQHHGALGGMQVQIDDVAYLFYEERICGEFEVRPTVGLQTESTPDAMDCVLRQPGLVCHRAYRPLGLFRWLGIEGFVYDFGHLLILNRPRSTWADFVVQAAQTSIQKPPAPLAHRRSRYAQCLRDILVGPSVSGQQHDLRAAHEPMRKAA